MSERFCKECGGLMSEFPFYDCTTPHIVDMPPRSEIPTADAPREFWILEYPGLGATMRNYGVSLERKNFEAMCANGALINFYPVIEKSAYDALSAELEKTKHALKLTGEGRPSEWAYTQLLNDFKDLQAQLAESTAQLNHCAVTGSAVAKERDALKSRLEECESWQNKSREERVKDLEKERGGLIESLQKQNAGLLQWCERLAMNLKSANGRLENHGGTGFIGAALDAEMGKALAEFEAWRTSANKDTKND